MSLSLPLNNSVAKEDGTDLRLSLVKKGLGVANTLSQPLLVFPKSNAASAQETSSDPKHKKGNCNSNSFSYSSSELGGVLLLPNRKDARWFLPSLFL